MTAFVSMHSLPAEHFMVFESVLKKNSISTQMIMGGVAKRALGSRKPDFDMDILTGMEIKEFSNEVAKICECVNIIFVGMGHQFAGHFLEAITRLYGDTKRVILYYENPEIFVPGGYSELAQAAVSIGKPREIAFANKNLAKEEISVCEGLEGVKKLGLGYYPMHDIEILKKLRTERVVDEKRSWIYLAGAEINIDYINKALPSFIKMLSEISFEENPTTLVFRKHPRSSGSDWKRVEALERPGLTILLDEDPILLNTLSAANYAFYYQTSLSPLLVLGGVNPIQVGHEVYHETLVDKGVIPVALNAVELQAILDSPKKEVAEEIVYDAIGYDPLWENRLLAIVQGVL